MSNFTCSHLSGSLMLFASVSHSPFPFYSTGDPSLPLPWIKLGAASWLFWVLEVTKWPGVTLTCKASPDSGVSKYSLQCIHCIYSLYSQCRLNLSGDSPGACSRGFHARGWAVRMELASFFFWRLRPAVAADAGRPRGVGVRTAAWPGGAGVPVLGCCSWEPCGLSSDLTLAFSLLRVLSQALGDSLASLPWQWPHDPWPCVSFPWLPPIALSFWFSVTHFT